MQTHISADQTVALQRFACQAGYHTGSVRVRHLGHHAHWTRYWLGNVALIACRDGNWAKHPVGSLGRNVRQPRHDASCFDAAPAWCYQSKALRRTVWSRISQLGQKMKESERERKCETYRIMRGWCGIIACEPSTSIASTTGMMTNSSVSSLVILIESVALIMNDCFCRKLFSESFRKASRKVAKGEKRGRRKRGSFSLAFIRPRESHGSRSDFIKFESESVGGEQVPPKAHRC